MNESTDVSKRIASGGVVQRIDAVRPRRGEHVLEVAARSEFELAIGRRVSDGEWAATKLTLVEFARTLLEFAEQEVMADPESPSSTAETLSHAA